MKNHRLVCKNKEQEINPKPPNLWFNKKIKCRDYKIRCIDDALYVTCAY